MEIPSIPKKGHVFSGPEIDEKFKATRYKGIRWSKQHNIVLLINSAKSNYDDSVNEAKKEIIYTGTGEKDQEFGTNIVTICNSKIKDPDSILLYFEKPTTGKYIFKSQVKYVDHHFEDEENKEGNMRRVIKFRLRILTDS